MRRTELESIGWVVAYEGESVNLYNIRIEQVPALWVAQQIGYRARPLLTVASSDREDVRLAFANRAA